MSKGLRDQVTRSGRCQIGNSRTLVVMEEQGDCRQLARALENVRSDRRREWLMAKLTEAQADLAEAREQERLHLVDCATCTEAEINRRQRKAFQVLGC